MVEKNNRQHFCLSKFESCEQKDVMNEFHLCLVAKMRNGKQRLKNIFDDTEENLNATWKINTTQVLRSRNDETFEFFKKGD